MFGGYRGGEGCFRGSVTEGNTRVQIEVYAEEEEMKWMGCKRRVYWRKGRLYKLDSETAVNA